MIPTATDREFEKKVSMMIDRGLFWPQIFSLSVSGSNFSGQREPLI
jgi:hypothetical protein